MATEAMAAGTGSRAWRRFSFVMGNAERAFESVRARFFAETSIAEVEIEASGRGGGGGAFDCVRATGADVATLTLRR